jgi:hypothetical protein
MDITWKHDTMGDAKRGQSEVFKDCEIVFQGVCKNMETIAMVQYHTDDWGGSLVMMVDLETNEVIDDVVFDVGWMRESDTYLTAHDKWAMMEFINFFHMAL